MRKEVLLVGFGPERRRELENCVTCPDEMVFRSRSSNDLEDPENLLDPVPFALVVDTDLEHPDTPRQLRRIMEHPSPPHVLLMAGEDDSVRFEQYLELGVKGLLDRESDCEKIVRAIRVADRAGHYIDPVFSNHIVEQYLNR